MLAAAVTVWTWWIEPCSDARLGCKPEDRDLAQWSVEAWSKASGGALKFTPVPTKEKARLRFYWAGPQTGMYGEARPFDFEGVRGAEIYLRPTIAPPSPQPPTHCCATSSSTSPACTNPATRSA